MLYLGTSGVIGLAIGDSFLFRAYRQIGPRVAMLVMSMSPAVAAVLAFVVLDERPSILGMFGMGVTLTGIAIVVNERRLGPAFARSGLASGVFFASLAAVTQGVGLIFAKLAFLQGSINGFVATAVRIASRTCCASAGSYSSWSCHPSSPDIPQRQESAWFDSSWFSAWPIPWYLHEPDGGCVHECWSCRHTHGDSTHHHASTHAVPLQGAIDMGRRRWGMYCGGGGGDAVPGLRVRCCEGCEPCHTSESHNMYIDATRSRSRAVPQTLPDQAGMSHADGLHCAVASLLFVP